jgi:hypothetical protein
MKKSLLHGSFYSGCFIKRIGGSLLASIPAGFRLVAL